MLLKFVLKFFFYINNIFIAYKFRNINPLIYYKILDHIEDNKINYITFFLLYLTWR